MPIDDTKKIDLDQAQDIGNLKSEVHTLNTLVTKLFKQLESLADRLQPKPMNLSIILAGAVSLVLLLGGLFGVVIYIANSSNAPLLAQMQQLNVNINAISVATTQNNSLIQLSNQRLSGINNKVVNNTDTLRWLLFDENIPKQIAQQDGRINMLEKQMNRVVEEAHYKGK